MIACLVLSPIRFDGIVPIGANVDLPEDMVVTLEGRGHCPIKRQDSDNQNEPSGDERQTEVFNAIAGLDPDNEKHFTKGGSPELKALNAALKTAEQKPVKNAAERNQLWAEYQKANPTETLASGEGKDNDDNQGNSETGSDVDSQAGAAE
jgi:hypothetical protein